MLYHMIYCLVEIFAYYALVVCFLLPAGVILFCVLVMILAPILPSTYRQLMADLEKPKPQEISWFTSTYADRHGNIKKQFIGPI